MAISQGIVENHEFALPFLFPLWYAWNTYETLANLYLRDRLAHIQCRYETLPGAEVDRQRRPKKHRAEQDIRWAKGGNN